MTPITVPHIHKAARRELTDEEARARGYMTADAYANWGYRDVPFTGDDRPDLEGRLRKALDKAGLTARRLMWGTSSAGTELHEVRFAEGTRGVRIPRRTDCAWCPFQGADDWFRLWRDHPDIYARAEAWERQLGHTFRNPRAKLGTWAASLEEMRIQFESGKLTREEKKRRLAVLEDEESDDACRVCRL